MSGGEREVIVVGAGPAGVSAAVQCAREGLDVLLVEKGQVGGLIYYARKVENFPGLYGLSGPEVAERLSEMLSSSGVPVMRAEVRRVRRENGWFVLQMGDDTAIRGRCVILATGTVPRSLGIPGEVHFPPWGDYTGKRVAVIGGGDVAFDYALRIRESGGEVTVLYRGKIRALQALRAEVERAGVSLRRGEVKGWERMEDLVILRTTGGEIVCDVPVVAIGREPHLPSVDGGIRGISLPHGKTDIPGLYVVGDAALGRYRQASLGAGMGVAAAMDCARWLSDEV